MSISHTAKTVLEGVPHLVTGGKAPPDARAGHERLASHRLSASATEHIRLSSPAFENQGRIPLRYTADGEGISPPLSWGEVPPGTRSLVLLVEDPDAPIPEPFVHWLVAGLPARSGSVMESAADLTEGLNTMMKKGWAGCAPPKGDSPHHYHFQLFATDAELPVDERLGRGQLLAALEGRVIGFGELVGTYVRPAG